MISVGRSAWCTTALETLPSSIARRPVSPRDPITIVAANSRSAISRIVFQTAPAASTAIGSARRLAPSRCARPRRRRGHRLGGRSIQLDEVDRAGALGEAEAARRNGRLPDGHHERAPTHEQLARAVDGMPWRPGIRRSRGAAVRQRSTFARADPPHRSSAAGRSAARRVRAAVAPASWRAPRYGTRSGCGRA